VIENQALIFKTCLTWHYSLCICVCICILTRIILLFRSSYPFQLLVYKKKVHRMFPVSATAQLFKKLRYVFTICGVFSSLYPLLALPQVPLSRSLSPQLYAAVTSNGDFPSSDPSSSGCVYLTTINVCVAPSSSNHRVWSRPEVNEQSGEAMKIFNIVT